MQGNVKERANISKTSEKYWRIYTLVFFVLAAAVIVIVRLYTLQVKAHEKYLNIAQKQHVMLAEIGAKRGEIFLSDEKEPYPLAVNKKYQMAYAVPQEIIDPQKTADEISNLMGLDKGIMLAKFSERDDVFEILKHKLSEDEAAAVSERKIPGIYLMNEDFRFYPGGELASQTVGFVGSDGEKFRGMYGIESYWERELRGDAGIVNQEKDTRGRWISIADREMTPAKNGDNFVLTINHTVQYEVEKILKEVMEKHGAEISTAIVVEVKTGKILAMASQPAFNSNDYAQAQDISVFVNPAVSAEYECGSVFKAITASAGINEGKIEPDSTYVDTGSVREAGYTIKNSEEKTYGKQTMTQVLENSINTGAIYIEKQVGNGKFLEYVKSFGFGQKTGIGLPGEISGNINNLENLKRNIHFFTASYGQGITVTPLQLVFAYAAIANKGKLVKPQIIEKIIHADGTEEETGVQEVRQVISEDSARKLALMLRSVVTQGHGKRADVPGYLVAGKTGTAQIAKTGERGYEEGVAVGSFAGFAPIDDAQFAVLVKIDNPKDVQWAESTAAPAFSKIMKFLLEYYGVEPTED
jgi:stage V sporulation protein D (sporulation-specific penicillin-binding protein)